MTAVEDRAREVTHVDGTEEGVQLDFQSLPDAVTEHLRRSIVNGLFEAGRRLPETEIAQMFDVSRATIRQALQRLEAERLVEVRPRRGAFVMRLSSQEAADLCEARGLLECHAAAAAVQALSEADLAEMRRLAREMAGALERGDVARLVELDLTFHRAIAACTPNRRVFDLWQELDPQLGALMRRGVELRGMTPRQVVARHLEVVEALAGRDPDEVQRVLSRHYVNPWPVEEAEA